MVPSSRLTLLVLGALLANVAGAQPTDRMTLRVRTIDQTTGAPVGGAEIADVGSSGRSVTAPNGEASLSVARRDSSVILVRKLGYEAQTIRLTAGDSAVVVRLRRIVTLPGETVEATGVSPELAHKLQLMGFLDRRRSSASPASTFITDQDIARRKPMLVSDLLARFRSGCTMYLDGVRLQGTPGGRGYRTGIDALLRPSEIAGIEVYERAALIPAQFAAIGRSDCVILFWLR